MPGIGVALQFLKTFDSTCADRVKVNVPDKFQKIRLFVNDEAFVPVLKKMALPVVPKVEPNRMASQQTAHHRGQSRIGRLKEQMEVIGQKCPGIKTWRVRLGKKVAESIEEILAIGFITKDLAPLDASSHDVME
jgi:hypothetical protein